MPFDLLGHQKASTYLKEALNPILLLIPTLILLHLGYLQPSDPFNILNYQLILFALPFAAFFILIFLACISLAIYSSERNRKRKEEKRKTYLFFRGWLYGLGGVFWEYASRIIYGLVMPAMLVIALTYVGGKSRSRPREISLKEKIIGVVFYPLLFILSYKFIETGFLQMFLLLGPVSLLGFLKSWGDYSYFAFSFPSIHSARKTADYTYATYSFNRKDGEFLTSLFAFDKTMRHSIYEGINFTSSAHTKTEINRLCLDYFTVANFRKPDLSFLLPENNSRSLAVEVKEEKPISGNDALFARICRFIYAVELPPYESISLTVNGNRMDFVRSNTNYRLAVPEEEPI